MHWLNELLDRFYNAQWHVTDTQAIYYREIVGNAFGLASALLGMIPLTPGGLGFVEAGLTGLLVLTGISAGDAAAATLAYRLVSYWLPLPAGVVAWILARRRYGTSGPVAVPSESITTSSS